ncbi:MAG: diacylglycerol/lipid kinase family protein [Longimicrobiales bacterium]
MSQAKPVCVVLNPVSGGGAGARCRPEIEQELSARGVKFELVETPASGTAVSLARERARRGAQVIVAAGGDGTVHDVVNGIMQAAPDGSCALGLIPVGTGNDFVKVVPGTRQRRLAYDTIARGHTERYDVGRVRWDNSEEYFINGMGTGIDVEVVRQLKRVPQLPGPLKYLLALLRALVRFRPVALRARLDEHQLEQRIMIIALGNGTCQGGGFYLAPDASPQDGLFDACVVDRLSPRGILQVLPRIMRGTQRGHPAVLMRTTRTARFEATDGRPLFFHLDGELREPAGLRALDIDVLPAALPVLTGERSVMSAGARQA